MSNTNTCFTTQETIRICWDADGLPADLTDEAKETILDDVADGEMSGVIDGQNWDWNPSLWASIDNEDYEVDFEDLDSDTCRDILESALDGDKSGDFDYTVNVENYIEADEGDLYQEWHYVEGTAQLTREYPLGIGEVEYEVDFKYDIESGLPSVSGDSLGMFQTDEDYQTALSAAEQFVSESCKSFEFVEVGFCEDDYTRRADGTFHFNDVIIYTYRDGEEFCDDCEADYNPQTQAVTLSGIDKNIVEDIEEKFGKSYLEYDLLENIKNNFSSALDDVVYVSEEIKKDINEGLESKEMDEACL